MTSDPAQDALIARAVAGDQSALSELLLIHYGPLAAVLREKLPDDMRGVLDVDDVVQEVHVEVFRAIERFRDQGENSFFRWLVTIASQRMIDKIRAHRRLKRGGDARRLQSPAPGPDGATTLLQLLRVDEDTPSQVIAGEDRARALHAALATLKDEYRVALQLRYIEGKPVAEIAAVMGRGEHAVHMLVNRGLKKLRAAIGSYSQHYSRKD